MHKACPLSELSPRAARLRTAMDFEPAEAPNLPPGPALQGHV